MSASSDEQRQDEDLDRQERLVRRRLMEIDVKLLERRPRLWRFFATGFLATSMALGMFAAAVLVLRHH
ncbi:MAG: hypothetical protein Q7V15_05265 [Phenylobacterium sp.]|uniref:hypothetical protein n=1 Tax=Phenylobacterium sp. TaxID=1871053 RepID=UPI00271F9C24|nr:hypothetical protein [Phenylobacterium sp.]MDO8900746.1 hypothetical protein [Phenylobacterium sp.]